MPPAASRPSRNTFENCSTVTIDPLKIIIPVYNEGTNFPSLWANIRAHIQAEFIAFVVYDFDEDDTVPAVQAIIRTGENRIQLVRNNVRKGVVGAIITGFDHIEHGPV